MNYDEEFANEIKKIFGKYVDNASILKVTLNDGSYIGMQRLIMYALGHLRHIDSQID